MTANDPPRLNLVSLLCPFFHGELRQHIRRFRQRQMRDIRVGFVCQPRFTMPHEFHRHARKHTLGAETPGIII